MKYLLDWLSKHKFEAYSISFLLMIVPCIPLFFAAVAGSPQLIIILLAIIVLGNVLAVLIR